MILGKANLTEFANFMTNGMPSGYSSLGGQVLNPSDADITPSGSSSGSGAAAAAGLAALTVGTETSGSIISPSAANGIVGLRPTLGLVSQAGILPIAASQDTAGPMARTVADAALELAAIDESDARATTCRRRRSPAARIGVLDNDDDNYQAAIAALQGLGAETVTIPTPTATAVPQVLTYEFKRDLDAYLARLPASAPIDSLADVIAYNQAHPEEALKFGQTQLIASQAVDLAPGSADTVAYEANLAAGKAANRAAIDDALTRGTADPADDLEAIMTPAQTLIGIGARAGYPQLTVPAGYDLDTTKTYNPVNVSFTGSAGSDAKLLAFGYAYEQATKLRLPPSQTNPSLWRCVPGSAFMARSCAPGEPPNRTPVATDVSGTVPATLGAHAVSQRDRPRRLPARRGARLQRDRGRDRDLDGGQRDAHGLGPERHRAARQRRLHARPGARGEGGERCLRAAGRDARELPGPGQQRRADDRAPAIDRGHRSAAHRSLRQDDRLHALHRLALTAR